MFDSINWDQIDWLQIWDYSSNVLLALLVAIGGLLFSSFAQRLVRNFSEKARIDQTLTRFFSKMTRWVILLIVGMFVLDTFGIDVSSFAVIIGAMGLAIGMALQGTLSHFASGVMLLIFRPFKVGDTINVAGVVGSVYEIDLFSTSIDTADNRRLIIPNSNVFGKTIENMSYHDTRRAEVSLGTSYEAEVGKTREVLEEVVSANPCRLPEKDGQVVLTELGDSSVIWKLRVWCKRSDLVRCKELLLSESKRALELENIDLPYPQLVIHN